MLSDAYIAGFFDGEGLLKLLKKHEDIDAVMAAQADLVEVVHTLKQVLCVKG